MYMRTQDLLFWKIKWYINEWQYCWPILIGMQLNTRYISYTRYPLVFAEK